MYPFPKHEPYEPQPDWVTHEEMEKDMSKELNDLYDQLISQIGMVLDTVEKLKEKSAETTSEEHSNEEYEEQISTLKVMLEAESQKAQTAENKLKAIMSALGGSVE
jgi:methionyl-tRNA formyltransferase